jgi:hypothetical protein
MLKTMLSCILIISVKSDILTQSDIVICDKTSSNPIDGDCDKKIVLLMQTDANQVSNYRYNNFYSNLELSQFNFKSSHSRIIL